jgi:hypothetical protein
VKYVFGKARIAREEEAGRWETLADREFLKKNGILPLTSQK